MILPIHPQPKPDEVLSSWMVRLAFANGFHLHPFYFSMLRFRGQIWNRDIDRVPHDELVAILSKQSGISNERILEMTLGCFVGTLFSNLPRNGSAQWVIPLGILHRKRKRIGMQFCTRCLQFDETPYFRKHWRLSLCSHCSMHSCLLNECCPCCSSPVAFHRNGIGARNSRGALLMLKCFACGFDLRAAPICPVPANDAKTLEILDLLVSKRVNVAGEISIEASELAFFGGVHTIARLVASSRGAALRELVLSSLGLDFPMHHEVGVDFDFMPVKTRAVALACTAWLLQDWPNRFSEACRESGIWRSRFLAFSSGLPFWLGDVVNERVDGRYYKPCYAEIFSAIEYLLARGRKVSPQELGAAMGIGRDLARAGIYLWKRRNSLAACNVESVTNKSVH